MHHCQLACNYYLVCFILLKVTYKQYMLGFSFVMNWVFQ